MRRSFAPSDLGPARPQCRPQSARVYWRAAPEVWEVSERVGCLLAGKLDRRLMR
jgi:hypothetical protein